MQNLEDILLKRTAEAGLAIDLKGLMTLYKAIEDVQGENDIYICKKLVIAKTALWKEIAIMGAHREQKQHNVRTHTHTPWEATFTRAVDFFEGFLPGRGYPSTASQMGYTENCAARAYCCLPRFCVFVCSVVLPLFMVCA